MPRRRLSEEARRDLMLRQGNLTALSQHPAWSSLEGEVERKEERMQKIVIAKTLGSGQVTLEELAYMRGFIHGMRWFVDQPPNAEASLEAFLRRQGVTVGQEVESGRS